MSRVRTALVISLAALAVCGCNQNRRGTRVQTREFDLGANPNPTPELLQNAAKVMAAQGREADAYSMLRRLIAEHPDYIPAYADMAEYHLRHNRPSEAERVLLEGLERAPEDAVLINNLGMVAMMRGDYARALEHFNRAADLAPGEVRHRSNMATALGLMGRYDESYAVYEQVVPPAYAHYNVSVLADRRGDADRAKQEFDAAVALDPGIIAAPKPEKSNTQD